MYESRGEGKVIPIQFLCRARLMATAAANSSNTNSAPLKGVKDLVDSATLKSLPHKYVLPPQKRPSALDIQQGQDIPIIDVSALHGSPPQRLQALHRLGQACADWGFFRVINHGIPEALIAEMSDAAREFFALPSEEKMKYAVQDVLNPVRYGTSFNAAADQIFCWRDYLKHFTYPLLQAPHTPSNYREVAGEYTRAIRGLALRLMEAISESLGLPSDYIENAFQGGLQIAVLNYYPECPEPELAMGVAPHSDHGGMTVLLQDDVAGLQVRHDGRWVAVEPVPGSFVVNVGDHLEILSNGRYKSVEHRAVVNAERARISIAVANGPALDALVFPAPQLVDDSHPQLYKAMLYGEYLRHQQSNQLKGKAVLELVKIAQPPCPCQ